MQSIKAWTAFMTVAHKVDDVLSPYFEDTDTFFDVDVNGSGSDLPKLNKLVIPDGIIMLIRSQYRFHGTPRS